MSLENGKRTRSGAWFLIRDGEEFGPCTEFHIQQLGANGSLLPTDGVKFPDGRIYPARQFHGLIPSAPDLKPLVQTPDDTGNVPEQPDGSVALSSRDDARTSDVILAEIEILDESTDISDEPTDEETTDSPSAILRSSAFVVDRSLQVDDERGIELAEPDVLELESLAASDAGHAQSAGVQRIKVALFIDFDNLMRGLEQIEANSVVNSLNQGPRKIIDWIEGHTFGNENDRSIRRVLRAVCYSNPASLGDRRVQFINAGFRIVDCPQPLGGERNAADLPMAIDVLDSLGHEAHIDEFILLVGDVDLRPILVRLKEHDRRTVVVATQRPTPAYAALSDRYLSLDEFAAAFLEHDDLEHDDARD